MCVKPSILMMFNSLHLQAGSTFRVFIHRLALCSESSSTDRFYVQIFHAVMCLKEWQYYLHAAAHPSLPQIQCHPLCSLLMSGVAQLETMARRHEKPGLGLLALLIQIFSESNVAVDRFRGEEDEVLKSNMAFFASVFKFGVAKARPMLLAACQQFFRVGEGQANIIAHTIKRCFSFFRTKMRNMGSGRYLAEHLRLLKVSWQACSANSDPSPSPSPSPPARRMLVRASSVHSSSSERKQKKKLRGIAGIYASSVLDGVESDDSQGSQGTVFVTPSGKARATSSQAPSTLVASSVPATSKPSGSASSSKVIQCWDLAAQAMSRITPDGKSVHAVMMPGPDGFLVACWPDGSQNGTEQPNVLVPAAPKVVAKKSGANVAKRPARKAAVIAAAEEPSSPEVEFVDEELSEPELAEPQVAEAVQAPKAPRRAKAASPAEQKYSIMYYKRNHSAAVRQKLGEKRQLFQVVGKKLTTKHQLEGLLQKAREKLHHGQDVASVKAWAQSLA